MLGSARIVDQIDRLWLVTIRYQTKCSYSSYTTLLRRPVVVANKAIITYIRVSTRSKADRAWALRPNGLPCTTSPRQRGLRSIASSLRWRPARARTRSFAGPAEGGFGRRKETTVSVAVAKLDRLSRDVHFISGLIAQSAVLGRRAWARRGPVRAAPLCRPRREGARID